MRIVDLSVSPVFSLLMVGWLVGVFANNYYFKQHNKKHYIKNKFVFDIVFFIVLFKIIIVCEHSNQPTNHE